MLVRHLVALLATAVIAMGYVAVDAGPARAGDFYNFFQFNVCGHRCETGNDTANDPTDPVRAIYKSLAEDPPPERAASLNELCRNQFDKLMELLPDEWRGRFVATAWKDAAAAPEGEEPYRNNESDLCFQDGREHNYGNAILVRAPILAGSEDINYLSGTDSTNEHRALICVTADLPTDTRFCSTHISPSFTTRQIADVATIVDGYSSPVVLMGDFNVEPDEDPLDPIYSGALFDGGATGRFEEADQDTPCCGNDNPPCRCGADTGGTRKIDYIFFTRVHFRQVEGFPADAVTDSDHHILRGRVETV